MKKLAIIRTESGINRCPFGLGIAKACRNAGNSVDKMVPLEKAAHSQKEFQTEHNIAVYMLHGKGKCKFADQVSEERPVVNCNFGDNAEGTQSIPINPIPEFPPYIGSAGLSVYQSYPFNEYWDELANITGPERLNGYASLESTENDALERRVEDLIQKITEEKK